MKAYVVTVLARPLDGGEWKTLVYHCRAASAADAQERAEAFYEAYFIDTIEVSVAARKRRAA